METNVQKRFGKRSKRFALSLVMTFVILTSLTIGVFATEPDPELTLNFDMAKMFTWAQMILDVMMPVVYITLGVALAFIIIRALKSAFA